MIMNHVEIPRIEKPSSNPAGSTRCDSFDDRPRTVPTSQPRWCRHANQWARVELLRADWSPMHFERLRLPFSNKKSSDSSVREEKY